MRTPPVFRTGWLAAIVLALNAPVARATWSIMIADSRTKEVAAGIVTCNRGGDLLPVVRMVVGRGVGVCQAESDPEGVRRPIIFEGLEAGTAPQVILAKLSGVSGHDSRQYGLVDVRGRAMTFTGDATAWWAGGTIRSQGTMVYAIQGNILAGDCVVSAIEEALRNTPGDIPAKLMAGMEAARRAGGDRRCSCPGADNPTECDCPPSNFAKSGHRGGMLVARIGDSDYVGGTGSTTVDTAWFMRLTVTCGRQEVKPDPVLLLRTQFDQWRESLVGRPDAVQSQVEFVPPAVQPGRDRMVRMRITLRDWRGRRVTAPIRGVSVKHTPKSAAISKIGEIADHGDGTLTVRLTAREGLGTDSFVVTVDDGVRPVVLMPDPSLVYSGHSDP